MSITSVGSSLSPQVTLPSAATGASASASASSKPDTDAPAAPAAAAKTEATTDSDASKGASTSDAKEGGASSASVGESMQKINPDGTMGPLHLPRPGHVVHA